MPHFFKMLLRAGCVAGLLCGVVFSAHAAEPVRVVASFSILGDMVRQIGGPHVRVMTLVGPEGDAHVYQPTPRDARALATASLVVVNGLGFEGWMQRLIAASGTRARVVTAADNLPYPLMQVAEDADAHHHGHGHGHGDDGSIDPHAWQDLRNGVQYVRNIASGLSAVDPSNASVYQANAAQLDTELRALDRWVRQQIGSVPAAQRVVMTSHDAFGYFAKAYGITFLAPQSLSTKDEPSARKLKTLIEQLQAGKTRALFIENKANASVIRQLAAETGAVIGPRLYADALSAADGPATSYQQMFRYNVAALVAGMQKNP
jgi:zinc/manganese transport system substrate-binding protein